MKEIIYLLCCFVVGTFVLTIQAQVPSTDIFLVDISLSDDGVLEFSEPKNVTDREGYDNQPYFIENGEKLLYSSMQDDKQTDIYCYNVKKGKHKQVTDTPNTSEYSPTPMTDGLHFSAVQVEADGQTQRLHQFDLKKGKGELLQEHIKGVGYHEWLNEEDLAAFIVGQPHTLQLFDLQDTVARLITGDIGRCIKKMPDRDMMSFVHKVSPDRWLLKLLNLKNWDIQTVIETLPQREDYTWLPDDSILMGHEGKLYRFHPSKSAKWQWEEVADFSNTPAKNFGRIAVNPAGTQIAIVATMK